MVRYSSKTSQKALWIHKQRKISLRTALHSPSIPDCMGLKPRVREITLVLRMSSTSLEQVYNKSTTSLQQIYNKSGGSEGTGKRKNIASIHVVQIKDGKMTGYVFNLLFVISSTSDEWK